MAEDYCISWGEIVRMMESVHGIKSDSKTKESFGWCGAKMDESTTSQVKERSNFNGSEEAGEVNKGE